MFEKEGFEKERQDSIKAIDNELERLHKTMKLLIDHPDRIIGDLLHSDVHDEISRLHRLLEDIAKRYNGLEY
jgi:hypothetical protein